MALELTISSGCAGRMQRYTIMIHERHPVTALFCYVCTRAKPSLPIIIVIIVIRRTLINSIYHAATHIRLRWLLAAMVVPIYDGVAATYNAPWRRGVVTTIIVGAMIFTNGNQMCGR